MATLLGITPRHYQEVEYGKINIPMLTLVAIADFFDCSIDYLTGRTNNPLSHKTNEEIPQKVGAV